MVGLAETEADMNDLLGTQYVLWTDGNGEGVIPMARYYDA
jgi:hypothetical protein